MPTLVLQGNKIVDPDGIDPASNLDYQLDLVDWLTAAGDTLLPMPAGLTVLGQNCEAHSPSISGTKVRGWMRNAVLGEEAVITFRFTTTGGRTDDKSIYVRVREK